MLKARYANRFKSKNIPIIILSNYPLNELYSNDVTAFQSLRARLKIVYVTKEQPIEMEKISFINIE